MSAYLESEKIGELIANSTRILIMQADNPDGDSLGSALALEQIFHEMGKEPILYCGMDIPSYLHYFSGWDRVDKFIPNNFDLSIVVDCSSLDLFETLVKANQVGSLSSRPCIVIDHHDVAPTIPFATMVCNQPAVATGQVIYELSKDLGYTLNKDALKSIASSILSDSLGLMSASTSSRSIFIIGEIVESGVSLTELEEARRNLMKKSPELIKYKGELLQRIEYFNNNKIAIITIPWEEITKYSQSYNPSMLVIDEMRMAEGNDVAIAFKLYESGRITAKIRCNYGTPIANELAKHFGGGGHIYASGFKIEAKEEKQFEAIKSECVDVASELIANLDDN